MCIRDRVYANEDQVVLYDNEGSDYVKQYADIPKDQSGLKGVLGTISRLSLIHI